MTNNSSQGLDFGVEEIGKVVSVESLYPHANLVMTLFSLYCLIGVCFVIFLFLKKKKEWAPPIILQDFPLSIKTATTLGLLSYCFVHILALIEVYLMTKVSFQSTSEYFFYMKLPKLAASSHAHFFGHGTMYLITSVLFCFSRLEEKWKIMFIFFAMSAGLLDVPSWWAIKYGSHQYELFSALAGVFSLIGFGFMSFRIFYELWWYELFGMKK